ncbi:unnamed protein product [Leptidea sinapis]|uniref:RNA helicase aquarius N-terminal domain-containing protein n=1 Tax=Leptidea sinapis TaxID=189913 RepID=A0A5E4QUC3_9NEOP|nr:unnamed protein product [Leptidea sinapis]
MIDLEALLPTRRFFNTVMDDCHLVVRCQLAPLARRSEGQLFSQAKNEIEMPLLHIAVTVIIPSIHVRHFVSPLTSRQGFGIAAALSQKKYDVRLPDDADVEYEDGLE